MANRNSLGEKFNSTINKCDICFGTYDRHQHTPVIICTMHHTVCKACMTSLQVKPNCPFCRQPIRFDKIVVNNYIYELLPDQPVEPNQRIETARPPAPLPYHQLNPGNQPPRPVPPPIRYESLQRQSRHDFQSLNARVAEPVYPDALDLSNDDHEDFYNSGQSELNVMLCLICIQLPFTIFNLVLALTQPHSECMDKAHNSSVNIVRPWLLSMGIIEATIITFLLLTYCLFKINCLKLDSVKKIGLIFIIIGSLKGLIWAVFQIQLFFSSIAPYCSGTVYGYGLTLTIIHGLVMLIVCCFGNCRT